ncbi:MAG: ferredoxin:glutaredoxin reductase [Dehalococcoidia bacterium]|nr:ferredoxin:glutaredoxin reductase [Dehalococcoidia bacterium]
MTDNTDITPEAVDRAYLIYRRQAESSGYHLNPDIEFTKALISGLLVNEGRYGYQSCPCRLASGHKNDDLDIICPCDYRDQDINEHGACYCALYVSQQVIDGTMELHSIPERRHAQKAGKTSAKAVAAAFTYELSYPVWRCKVCGYLCARDGPPEVCPICKAKKDRFGQFL